VYFANAFDIGIIAEKDEKTYLKDFQSIIKDPYEIGVRNMNRQLIIAQVIHSIKNDCSRLR